MKNSSVRCSIHNSPCTHFCLAKDCPSNILCELCYNQTHKVHFESVHNIKEYFSQIPYSQNKIDESLIFQIQGTIQSRVKLVDEMDKKLMEAENVILEHFDELKKDILFLLDIAYQQYTKQIREIHSNSISELDRTLKKLSTMCKIQEMISKPNITNLTNEDELREIIRYLSRYQDKMNNFFESFKLRYQQFETSLDNYKTSINVFDPAHFNQISSSICSFVKTSFNIKEEGSGSQNDLDANDNKKGSYTGHEGEICSLAILTKELIATAGRDALIKLWNLASGECIGELAGHKDVIWSILSVYEGKYLLSASSDKTIKLWKIAERRLKKTFKAHTKSVLSLAFYTDEKILASGSQDTSIILWDMQEGKPTKTMMGHTKAVWALKETKKGTLISGSEDCLIKIWDIKNCTCIQTIHGHKDTIYNILSFNDDKNIITCSDDETLRVWEVDDGICVQVVKGHEKGVRCLAINSEETLVASGGYDQCLRIWNLKTMKQLKVRDKNDGVIRGVKFFDDYSVLYTDKHVKLFKLNIA